MFKEWKESMRTMFHQASNFYLNKETEIIKTKDRIEFYS